MSTASPTSRPALDRHAEARGWGVITRRISDNDLSATNGKPRPGYDE